MSSRPKKANPGCSRGSWTQRLSKHQAQRDFPVSRGFRQALEYVEELLEEVHRHSEAQQKCGPAELGNQLQAGDDNVDEIDPN